MNIPALSIKNAQITALLAVLLLALGVNAFLSMPQLEDPVVDIPTVVAVNIYPGANPGDIESQVIDPIEEAINELDDIESIISTIRDGVGITEVEFLTGTDPEEKLEEVQRKLNEVADDLPPGLYDQDVFQFSTSSVAIMQLALISETATSEQLHRESEQIKQLLEPIDGIRKVELLAYPETEVRIGMDPIKMAEMNISIDQVSQAIQSNNANIPGGAIKVSNKLFNIKTSGSYDELEQIRNTVVGSVNGTLVYLKNIATVQFTEEDVRWRASYNGKPGMYLTIQQKEGYNIFDVAEPIKEKIAAYTLPQDMSIHYVFDQSAGVEERVSGFLANLVQGILLVGLIILLVLGYRSAALVMLAIPFSILIGLYVVDGAGFALQQISIAGLVVALGLLVDNSIAILENIERFLRKGKTPAEAAIAGTQQLIAPITSATLTTVLAFIPIISIPDETGEFIKALPVTVIATLVASLLIAVTLTPLLAARILNAESSQKYTVAFRTVSNFVKGPYRRVLSWAFRNKWIVVAGAVFSLVGALALAPLVGLSFFPKAEKPQFRITFTLPNGTNLDATGKTLEYIESVLAEKEEVAYYATNVGHGNPRIYYNVASVNYSNSYGELFVVLKEYNVADFYALLDELRATFKDYADARIDVKEFVQGPPSEAPVAIKIFGDDLDVLEEYAREVEQICLNATGAINVNNPTSTRSTDLYFNIHRDKAMMFGVPIFQIDQTIRTFVNGQNVGTFRDEEANDYNIIMRYEGGEDFQLTDFDKIKVQSVSGRFIPLQQLANIEFKEAPSRITHLDMERTTTVLADLDKGYTLDEVISEVETGLEAMAWEDGYRYEFKGDLENRNNSFGGLGAASLTALFLILVVLVVQFKSFSQPMIIFSALPLAIIGSILALLITGINFSFTAFVGLTSLIGIAINNSIVLVDFANKAREEGATVEEAAREAGEVRFIPIVMTTLTTILGLLPLTLNGGSLWAPMGWTIIGGLLTSTTFVLLLVPILYYWFTPKEVKNS